MSIVKKTGFAMTALDGRQPIQLWDKDEFRGRVTQVYSGNIGKMTLEHSIPIPDDSILCDFCNANIKTFPVLIFHGSALCPECVRKYMGKVTVTESPYK